MIPRSLRALFGALAVFILTGFTGCNSDSGHLYHFTRFSMDTVVDYSIIAADRETAKNAMLDAQEEIERIASLLWEGDTSSVIFHLNHTERSISPGEEVISFLARGREYTHKTGGAFDMSIFPVFALYDFQSEHPESPDSNQVQSRLRYVGMTHLRILSDSSGGEGVIRKLYPESGVAVGGIAKGYAVDRAINILQNRGISDAIINAGGDLYCLGRKSDQAWKVGIQNPRQPNEITEVLRVSDRAVATSGDYQRYFSYEGNRYHHILNPETGWPARSSRSATVIAPTVEEADAWATAMFILGAEHGIPLINQHPDLDAMVIDSAGLKFYSEKFPGYLLKESQ